MQIAILSNDVAQPLPPYAIFAADTTIALTVISTSPELLVNPSWSYVDGSQTPHTIDSPLNFTIPPYDSLTQGSSGTPSLASIQIRVAAANASSKTSTVSIPIYILPAGTQRDDILLVYGTDNNLYLYFQPTSQASAPSGPYLIPELPTFIPEVDVGQYGSMATNLTSDGEEWITCVLVNLASNQIQPG